MKHSFFMRHKRFHPLFKNYAVQLGILLLVIVGLPLSLYLSQKQETVQQHAASSSVNTQPTTYDATLPCGLQGAAFCDTFDKPEGIGNRSGDLNGTVWGESRTSDGVNTGQGQFDVWAQVRENQCGTTKIVQPENDVAICNGQLVEAINDDGGQKVLALYPKQPFDIAGRTGTVAFDVSEDSEGGHAAWPSFAFTDQPVPAPNGGIPSIFGYARNSFGFDLDGTCGAGSPCDNCPYGTDGVTVGSMYYTKNNTITTLESGWVPVRQMEMDSCVKAPTLPGQVNHFRVLISQSHVEVWGTDPDSNTFVKIAETTSAIAQPVPLTRGLIWIEDEHYNADKFNDQASHTFTWDNVGFDGPVLPRDLAFDVLDSLTPEDGLTSNTYFESGGGTTAPDPVSSGLKQMDLGYYIPGGNTLTLQVPGVYTTVQPSAALLTLNLYDYPTTTISYRVNNGAWQTQTIPVSSSDGNEAQTLGLPVTLSDVVTGTNTIQLKTSDPGGMPVANIDLIMVGAGGTPCSINPSQPCGSGTPISTLTNTPVPSQQPTSTLTPTVNPTNTPTPRPTNTPIPTNTPVPQGTTLSFPSILLHGLGDAGDSVNPGSGGNMTPLHPSRTVTVSFYNGSAQLVTTKTGTITYQSATGDFKGTVDLGTGFTSGTYTIKVSTPQYLVAQVPGFYTVMQGQSVTLPQFSMVTGDANADNQDNILDYNMLLGCYSDLAPATNCPGNNKQLTDFSDDGSVNQTDYNLFLRELSVRTGQ